LCVWCGGLVVLFFFWLHRLGSTRRYIWLAAVVLTAALVPAARPGRMYCSCGSSCARRARATLQRILCTALRACLCPLWQRSRGGATFSRLAAACFVLFALVHVCLDVWVCLPLVWDALHLWCGCAQRRCQTFLDEGFRELSCRSVSFYFVGWLGCAFVGDCLFYFVKRC
jgi:hypothetical protein